MMRATNCAALSAGAIPASLGELPLLRTLVLEGNRLGGE